MGCAKAVNHYIVQTGPYKGEDVLVDGPEYENAAGLGSNCGIFDPDYIIEANFYCDTYGMDTISWATNLAFVMECYENGVINQERTGGLELNFGNTAGRDLTRSEHGRLRICRRPIGWRSSPPPQRRR